MPRSLGRAGRRWRRARANVLAASTICWLCGHDGAGEADHDPPLAELEAAGIDPCDERYLKPAHGVLSRCETCGRCCNQSKGNRPAVPAAPTSRAW